MLAKPPEGWWAEHGGRRYPLRAIVAMQYVARFQAIPVVDSCVIQVRPRVVIRYLWRDLSHAALEERSKDEWRLSEG